MGTYRWGCVCALLMAIHAGAAQAHGATIHVAAGGNLQQALNAAQPGDTILLAEGAEFVGNFVLPVKTGDAPIVVRTSAPDSLLPGPGQRIRPSHAPLLARLRSANTAAVLRTAPGAHHWELRYLELAGNQNGYGDIMQIGDGSSAQNSLALVPHTITLSHLYVHGDPAVGQKRCISLNAAHVRIVDSHVSDCKAVGQDAQAIAGWNGPGPYVIENNYLEGAGENVLFGGSDPAIANLVADGIVFRRNHLSRPMSWRDPVIGTPLGLTSTAEAGGSLPSGTHAYRVVARGPVGQGTTGRSTASAEVVVTVNSGAVRLRWQAVPGATEYRVYGRVAGAQNVYWRVTAPEFVDTGLAGTAEAVPTSVGTVWTVKNLFELKNARNVLVQENVFENHWKQAQPGYAIVITPRNSGGKCTWCVVERVVFEYNVVRNVAAGVNLLGYDVPSTPSRQTNAVVFRQNLFHQMKRELGGNAWFMLIGDEPRDLTIEHNTIDSDGTTVTNTYGGTSTDPRLIYGFKMSANAARHGSYGFGGSFYTYGLGILNGFYPDYIFTANYLAGGASSRYPAGTLLAGTFPDQFVDAAGGDFTVRPDSVLKGRAPDGSDIGVHYAELAARIAGVEAGRMPDAPPPVMPAPPSASFTSACTDLTCVFTDTSVPGDAIITSRTWSAGPGTGSTGQTWTYSFTGAGTYDVTLTVADANGLTASVTEHVSVTKPHVPPVAAFTSACTGLTCVFTDTSTAGDSAVTARAWSLGSGTASTQQTWTHSFAATGTYGVTLTVTDANGLSASVTRSVSVTKTNVPPVASFLASCTDLVCVFTCTSTDSDGTIASRTWTFADGTASGQTVTRTMPAAGSHAVTLAVADNAGATASVSKTVPVTALLHLGALDAVAASSNKGASKQWSATVKILVHGGNERPISNARVDFAWSGALVRTGSCVTDAAGACTVGTGSIKGATVTLTVTAVSAASSTYMKGSNHGTAAGASVTVRRPN